MANRFSFRRSGPWLLILLLILGLAGSGAIQLFVPANKDKMQMQAVVHEFMQSRLSRDDARVRTFLTQDMHAHYIATGQPDLLGGVDPHYERYRIISQNKLPDNTWLVKVRITQELAGKGDIGWFEEELQLVPVHESYLIGQLTKGHSTIPVPSS